MNKIFSNRIVSVVSSVVASSMVVALVGYAATTITTSITTGGTLTVSGASTLTGAVTASGNLTFDGTSATTTISGGLRADTSDNTLVVDFSSSRVGIGTTSPMVLLSVHGAAILGSADGDVLAFRSGTWQLTSEATTTINSSKGININSGSLILNASSTGSATAARLYVGTSTPIRGNFAVEGTGTTSLVINTTAPAAALTSQGSCIELKAIGGIIMHMFATSSDEGYARLERGSCTTTLNE